MKVKELIEALKSCDQELEVMMYYDGDARQLCDSGFLRKKDVYWRGEEEILLEGVLVLCEQEDVYITKEDDVWAFGPAQKTEGTK